MKKRVISILLIVTMLVGVLPAYAQAEENQTTIDNGELTIEGTSGFGALLADDIAQEQEAIAAQSSFGYTVTDLQITGNVATVTYDSLEEATLVVALYSEDGMQLLASGKTTVDPEQTQVSVAIDGEMPEFFLASAYLLDGYDMSPLCPAYDTPLYTQEMQTLLISTVEDYDADRVLQLEESTETNFAVYAETTKVIEPAEGVNIVVSVDDESFTYVIENADANITSLKTGEIFAYPYGEDEILIVKVGAMTLDGTKATITGEELEIEEVFSHVKLEGEKNSDNLAVDESSVEEGITYEGTVEEGPATRSANPLYKTIFHQFKIDIRADQKGEEYDLTGALKGSVSLKVDFELDYYITFFTRYVKFKATPTVEASIGIMGSVTGKIPLPPIGGNILPGISIRLKPKLIFRFSGELSFSFTLTTNVGVCYDSKKGVTNLTTKPKIDFDVDVAGSVFVGIDLGPTIDIGGGTIATLNFALPIGLKLNAEMIGSKHEDTDIDAEYIHSCASCIAMKIVFEAKLSLKFKLLKSEKLSVSIELGKLTIPLKDRYYSIDHKELGYGTCPYKAYRITISVVDAMGSSVSGVAVNTAAGKDLGNTNSKGVLVTHLPGGNYQLSVTVNGKAVNKKVNVSGACYVKIAAQSSTSGGSGTTGSSNSIIGAISGENVVDDGYVIASGACGGSASWKLHSSGTLNISGTGTMENYPSASSAPWYSNRALVKKVVIRDGITSVGSYAFAWCYNLTDVSLPDSVKSIEKSAFYYCSKMTGVTIPAGVTSIGSSAFRGCENIVNIAIPSGVTSINVGTFYDCSKLTGVTLPAGITSIESSAFYRCRSLSGIIIPDGVTSIGSMAFMECSSLTKVTIPASVIKIDRVAFDQCSSITAYDVNKNNAYYTSDSRGVLFDKKMETLLIAPGALLGSYTIPAGVTRIGDRAFYCCSGITSVTIPASVSDIAENAFRFCSSLEKLIVDNNNGYYANDNKGVLFTKTLDTILIAPGALSGAYQISESVSTIGPYAFAGCAHLTKVSIPTSVTKIEMHAFSECSSLDDVTLPVSINGIEDHTFYGCSSLSNVIIPESVTSIGYSAFNGCSSLAEIKIPNSVTSIDEHAFSGCSSLTDITIPEGVTCIEYCTFSGCQSLTNIKIPENVTTIGPSAFSSCKSLSSIWIPASVTQIDSAAFFVCSRLADVYYAGTQTQWNAITIGSSNDSLTGASIHCNSAARCANSLSGSIGSQISGANAVFGGEYGTEPTDSYTVKTASFTELVPGKEYVLLALASVNGEDPLAAENLLFVDQATAAEDGTLSFRYIQRIHSDTSYVMACGASTLDLADAEITFQNMIAVGETQVIQPTVVYDGKILIEGQDYVIAGDVAFNEAGEYTCYFRGIYAYTGLVSCTYTVREAVAPTVTLKYPTVSFEDVIVMNVYYTAENLEDVVEMGLITYSSEVSEWSIDNAQEVIPGYSYSSDKKLYVSSTNGIAAKKLGDTLFFCVYAKLTDGTYTYTKLVSYSPETYAYSQLATGAADIKPLVVAMLKYGAAAQVFFNHNTDALVDRNLTADQLALIESYRFDIMATVATPSEAKQGTFLNNGGYINRYPTISFEGAFAINYYYTPSYVPVDGITMYYWNQADFDAAEVLTVENATAVIAMEGEGTGRYSTAVEGIAAKDLDKGIYVAFVYYDGTTTWVSGVLSYSIGTYCGVSAAGGTDLVPLAEATAVYGYHAKQIFYKLVEPTV